MNGLFSILVYWVLLFAQTAPAAQPAETQARNGYLGLDRNDYPGDKVMGQLRKQFSFTGYWLTPPPEEKSNSWIGKHKVLEAQGYGFLLIARGRALNKIRNATIAQQAGTADGREAAHSVRRHAAWGVPPE